MDFGLGLILSFTDNATAGINNAVNSLNKLTQTAEGASNSLNEMATLSALSVVTNQIGGAFLSAGHTILSTLGQIVSEVNNTGQSLMYAENQLNALYRDSDKTGKQVLGDIQAYAKNSMFAFEDLIPAVTSLKSVGIEAFDSITSSMGNSKNNLLDYASALASFAPQMKNAYGTGINAAIGAMREYIAEGNAMSLKRGAGLDITGILGEDKGATIQERTRQVADLIETLGMLDMVEIMENSPMTKLSNIGDILFQLKGMIAESGVRDSINGLIDIFYNFVSSIGDERLQTIANNLGSALTSLITPLEWVAKRVVSLADGLVNIAENNPALVKFATVGVAVAGVLLLLGGIILKATSAMSGLSLMLLTMGKSFTSIGALIKMGSLKMLGTLLPLTATIALLALAWKSDLGGIRTTVTNFVSNLTSSFKTARQAVDGDVSDLVSTLTELKNKDDFFSNLTLGIMKVMMAGKALSDAWGDYELSEENFLKAKELGILPLIEAILDIKYRFEHFAKGFLDGWNKIGEGIRLIIGNIVKSVDGTFLEPLIEGLTDFFQMLSSGDAQTWYDFGSSFAVFTALVGGFVLGLKAISGVIGIVTSVIGFFTKLWGAIKLVVSFLSSAVGVIGGFLGAVGGFVTAVLGFFGVVVSLPATLVGIITVALVALVAVVIAKWEEIKSFISGVGEAILTFVSNAWNTISSTVSGVVSNIASKVSSGFNTIKSKVSSVVGNIRSAVSDAFNNIKSTISDVIENAKNTVSNGLDAIKGFFSNLTLKLPHIKLPHFNISGSLSLSPPSVPKLSVDWYEKGGVFNKPSLIGVGENGQEAVMPLEKNTGWIGLLADKLMSYAESNLIPTNSNQMTNTKHGETNNRYMTNNSTNNSNHYEENDNSIVFNKGAIQLNVQNASEEEAIRLAKKIMEYIKRQRELDRMLAYA